MDQSERFQIVLLAICIVERSIHGNSDPDFQVLNVNVIRLTLGDPMIGERLNQREDGRGSSTAMLPMNMPDKESDRQTVRGRAG